jgi:hypothetical protein
LQKFLQGLSLMVGTTRACDEASPFQSLHSGSGTGSVYAQHDRKQLVRERQGSVLNPIIRHQQPARQPFQRRIFAVGYGCLRNLHVKGTVAQQRPMQPGTLRHGPA